MAKNIFEDKEIFEAVLLVDFQYTMLDGVLCDRYPSFLLKNVSPAKKINPQNLIVIKNRKYNIIESFQ